MCFGLWAYSAIGLRRPASYLFDVVIMEYVICFRCWETVENPKRIHNKKFCAECARKCKAEMDRHRMRKYSNLGTSGFHEHRCKNFDREYEYIQKEKKKLRL